MKIILYLFRAIMLCYLVSLLPCAAGAGRKHVDGDGLS